MARGNEVVLKILGDASGAIGALKSTGDEGEKTGKTLGKAMAAAGAVVAGFGVKAIAAGEQARGAHVTLVRAVENTGKAYEDYDDVIDETIKKQAKYGQGTAEVQRTLAQFTMRLNDPKKAIEALTIATDLAALKHISLGEAATLTTKLMGGNAKAFAQFGIDMKASTAAGKDAAKALEDQKTASDNLWEAQVKLNDLQAVLNEKKKITISDEIRLREAHEAVTEASAALSAATENVTATQTTAANAIGGTEKAMALLKQRVAGFADQEANTLTGRMRGLQTQFENFTAELGQRFGPAMTVAGTAFGTLSGAASQFSDITGTNLLPALKNAELGFNGTAAAAATTTLAILGAVGAGVALGFELNQLIEKHFPAFNRALEGVGARVSDLNEELRKAPGLLGKINDAMNKITTLNPTMGIGKFIGAKISDLFRAGGGPVTGGKPYIVGEQGPELMVPGRSGTVVPNHAMGGWAGRGGTVIYLTLETLTPTRETGRQLAEVLGEHLGNGGSIGNGRGASVVVA